MAGIVTNLRQLKNGCWDALSSRLTRWTKSLGTSLPVGTWQQALVIVQPDTLLRGPRELFRLYWKRKSKTQVHKPKVAVDTIALIKQMARDNRLWGAERIRGELLKLGIRVCKRTIQKYMRTVRTHQSRGQRWATDLEQPCLTDLGM